MADNTSRCGLCKEFYDPRIKHKCKTIFCTCGQPQQGPEILSCPKHSTGIHDHPVGTMCKTNCPGFKQAAPLRQKTSAERKAEPIHSGPMMYHPDALAAHARLCVAGNVKHNGPDAPLSWARGKSMDHLECAARHMLTPDAIDPETGETELTAAFWRLGCALQLQQERLLKEKGIMPYSGIVS